MFLLDYRVYGALFGAILFALFLGLFSNALVVAQPGQSPGLRSPERRRAR